MIKKGRVSNHSTAAIDIPTFKFAVLSSLIWLPAIALAGLVWYYGVNVPFGDQWDNIAVTIENFFNNQLSAYTLLQQHNESRTVVSRIAFLILAYLTDWNIKAELFAIWTLAVVVAINIYQLHRFSFGGDRFKIIILALLCNLLIFSPIQHENWLWGMQVVFFIPLFCLSTGLIVATRTILPAKKCAIAATLATVSTFGFANGLLCWIVAVPTAYYDRYWQNFKQSRFLILAWIAAFLANVVVYFSGYQKPVSHPTVSYVLQHPHRAIAYYLSYLGSPLGSWTSDNRVAISATIGIVILTVLIAGCVSIIRQASDRDYFDRAVVWLTLAAYALLTGAVTTVGRVGGGLLEQSLSSKYTSVSVYLLVALIPLLALASERLRQTLPSPSKLWIRPILGFLATILIVLYIPSYAYGIDRMAQTHLSRLQGKACLVLLNVAPQTECLTQHVFSKFLPIGEDRELRQKMFDRVNYLNQLGFIHPPLLETDRVTAIAADREPATPSEYGWLENLEKVGDHRYRARGWAFLPETNQPADAVILTYQNDRDEPILLTVSYRRLYRADIADTLQRSIDPWVGWQAEFNRSDLPQNANLVRAWAFNSRSPQAFPIEPLRIIPN
jgi:hypothetical protein